MVWQKGFKKKHKIADRWGNVTYKVIQKLDSKAVYKIRPCTSQSSPNPQQPKICIVHCNMLFPVSWDLNDIDRNSKDKSVLPVSSLTGGTISHTNPMKSIAHNIQDIMLKTSHMILGW